jgi:hypothetical protein
MLASQYLRYCHNLKSKMVAAREGLGYESKHLRLVSFTN